MFIGNIIADAILGIMSGIIAGSYNSLFKLICICIGIDIIALFTFQRKEFKKFRVFTLEPSILTPIVWFMYRTVTGFIIISIFSFCVYLIKNKIFNP